MKLSINWLNKFLSLDEITPEEVASKLTMASFEVEEIHKVGPKLKGPIVVGKILEIQKHPNADKLQVTKVTTDGKNALQIVCGAKNIKVGHLVPVSLPGSVVINRQDGSEFLIKTTKIRDIESCGMLLAPSELGINSSQDPNGILILSEDARVGNNVIDYLALYQDIVLEVASRSNRGDALSILGLGKEISAITNKKLKEISFKEPKVNSSVKIIKSKIENLTETYLFFAVTIENLKVTESPNWLKRLLEAIGLRPINNIVDITNYINFSFGQPMHAYDKAKIKQDTLNARLSKKNEKIVTLDGKTRELKEGILVIADEDGPLGIAGIMGGKDSEVTETTKDIVLEAAVFNPVTIRKGSRAVGLSTEASKRFERGVDSNFTRNSLVIAIQLIEELAQIDQNNKPRIGEIFQSGNPIRKENVIDLETNEIKRVLGIEIKVKEIIKILENLNFKTKEITPTKIEVQVPTSRAHDVHRPIDLIEEIARLYGYDQILPLPPRATLCPDKSINGLEKIKNYFLGATFSETYLSSLIGEHILNYKEFTFDNTQAVKMMNPLSKEHVVLRQNLLGGLIEALKLNQSHQISNIKLFEIGKAYLFNKTKPRNEKETSVTEILKIAGIRTGCEDNWYISQDLNYKNQENLFFSIKGLIESLLIACKCNFSLVKGQENFLHPNFSLKVYINNESIGSLGCLHPQIEKVHKLVGPVAVFEFSLVPILKELEKGTTFQKISQMPTVERDITADLQKKFEATLVTNEINKIKSYFVISVNLISVYELDKETRSLTYRLKMQDFAQTLTSKQIEEEVDKIKNHLNACFQVKFRV